MYEIVYSEDIESKNLKILFRGPEASRKTETALRFFPHVLILDSEGNADQCAKFDAVPPFLRIETKDVYKILEVMDDVIAGKIKFPDGALVETLCIDSVSVLWSVRQEVGAMLAEKRALRYAKGKRGVDPDAVNMAQLDWVKAKRPLKRLHAKFNASGIKYLILTAREKDKYETRKKDGKDELVKVGTMMDGMKGLQYEVNIAFRMFNTEPWHCEVTKVQGALGLLFPEGSTHTEFPYKELIAYAAMFNAPTGGAPGVIETAEGQLDREINRTQKNLIQIAKDRGIGAADVAVALKAVGIKKFDAGQWDEMVKAIEDYQSEA